MAKTYGRYFTIIVLIIACSIDCYSQQKTYFKNALTPQSSESSINIPLNFRLNSDTSPLEKTKKSSSVLPISIGVLAVVYMLNPIVIYTEKKVYLGITKEFSVGWGKLGEHRTAMEYSMIFAGNIKHYMRFSYKYDFLLEKGIQPSHMLQGTAVFSAGAGYFTDFHGKGGVFPELSYGYSIRNHKLLFFPHIKLRHTFMFNKDHSDITDISFGIILGVANPFIDVDIKRRY